MPDDWNTINARPGEGGVLREIDLLRRKYADHRSTLERLARDAPSEALAERYRQLIVELEASMAKIADLELQGSEPEAEPPATAEPSSWRDRPFHAAAPAAYSQGRSAPGSRTLLIVLAGIFMIVILALLAWNWLQDDDASAGRPVAGTVAEEAPPVTIEPAEPYLAVEPETQDFGTIRRGARAARQFEVVNRTGATLPIQVRRSTCRCLWFEYAATIPPLGTTTLTVTVDGSKVEPGRLVERIEIVSKSEPPISATFEVTANIQ